LIEQVACKQSSDITVFKACALERNIQRNILHLTLGTLPGIHIKAIVSRMKVEKLTQGAFKFLFPYRVCAADDG
jgi:hypothetical protein